MIGSVDAVLLKPSYKFRTHERGFLSDHRELSVSVNVSDYGGLGEMPKKVKRFFVDYEKMSFLEIKKWWETELLGINKLREEINCDDFIKLFGKLTNRLWTPNFKKSTKNDPEIEILKNCNNQEDFFSELCENVSPENLWETFNRVKNCKEQELKKENLDCVKTKFVKDKNGKSVPFEKVKSEIVSHFKRDIRQKRAPMLSRKKALWVDEKLNNFTANKKFISKLEVIRALKNINQNVSVGEDHVSPKLIPTNSSIFIDCLHIAIRNAFTDSKFPNTLKIAKLAFFLKPSKSEKSELQIKDFRGICIAKYLMKIIDLVQLYKYTDHLETSGLRDNHHGFRTLRGCTDNFSTILAKIRKNREKKLCTALLLCDLSSAYNRLDHGLLIYKLLQAGVDPQLVKFTAFWLKDRVMLYEHWVIIAGANALPQGSSVSPILFIYYCDYSLPSECGESVFLAFADDSTMKIVAKSWTEVDYLIEKVLKSFNTWARQNGLALSVSKTEILCLYRKKKELKLNCE